MLTKKEDLEVKGQGHCDTIDESECNLVHNREHTIQCILTLFATNVV